MRKGERDATASLYLSDANGSFLGRCIQRVKGLRPGYDRRVMDVEIVVKGLAVKGEKPEMKRLDPLNKPVPMAMRSARQCTVRLQDGVVTRVATIKLTSCRRPSRSGDSLGSFSTAPPVHSYDFE